MQTQPPPPRLLSRTVQAEIGRMLRAALADFAAEPLPQRFIELLASLEARERG